MSNVQIKISRKNIIFAIFFGLATIWMIRYSSSALYNYLALIEFLLAFVLAVTQIKLRLPIRQISVLMFLLLFIGISLGLIFIISPNKLLDMKYLGVLCVYLSPIVLFQWLRNNADLQLKSVILKSSYFIWVFYGIKQLIFYLFHSGAARHLAANPLYYGKIAIGGGYFFAYGSVLLVVYLFERIIFIKKGVWTILLCGLCFIHVVMTESMLSTIGMLLGIGLVLLKVIAKKMRMNLFSVFFLGVFCFALFFFSGTYKTILSEIYNLFLPIQRPYAWRIIEIIDLLLGNGIVEEGAIQLRLLVYKDSIATILQHPLVGTLLDSNYFGGQGIGGHSEILDSLARWGMIVGGLYLGIYCGAINSIYKQLNCKIYLLVFLWMIFFNPVSIFHFSFIMFLVIPLQQVMDREA